MIERFQLNRALVLVLFLLLQSFLPRCHPEYIKHSASNADNSNSVIEEQRNKLDPSIEQIFRGPSGAKSNVAKTSVETEDSSKRARVKRDSAFKRSNSKSLNEAAKSDAKRSISNRDGKASSRIGRSSKNLAKLSDKDYEASLDQDKSEYVDEGEDDPAVGSKESSYKGGEFRVGEDSERFIDQEERSSLYDDFEVKDVAKRGISGAEDYEEMEEEAVGSGEDVAASEDRALDEETDKRKIQGDVRIKREQGNSKEANNAEVVEKAENSVAASDSSNDPNTLEASLKRDDSAAENQANKADKESGEQADHAKRNVEEKTVSDASKVNSDREIDGAKQSSPTVNDQTELGSSEDGKLQSQESREAAGDGKTREGSLSSDNNASNGLVGDASGLKGTSKCDQSKVAEVPSPETAKVEASANVADAAAAEEAGKLENPKNEEATGDQADADYEKRVEEQIQRKIDSIKEEIKREIEENERMKEIEENNARFDELREQEDDEDEEQAVEAEASDKRDNLSKRSVRNSGKSKMRDDTEKRLIRRKKMIRQSDNGEEKAQSGGESENKKSRETATKKRSVAKAESTVSSLNEMPKKRQHVRQVFLVENDRRKKRRRRSKNSVLAPEQRSVKQGEIAPANFVLDSNLQGEPENGKSGVSKMAGGGKVTAQEDSSSGSEASLAGSNEEMGPLATEYGEAFGGLNGDPGVALARFKRIKRVLRPPASKMQIG